MEKVMDSLKVSGTSFVGMGAVFTDLLPWILGVAIAIMNIAYLYLPSRHLYELGHA